MPLESAEDATKSSSRFSLPDFIDPASGVEHTDFTFEARRSPRPTFMVRLMWRGELKFGGGYPEVPNDGYMSFAASPQDAPIAWINGDGPFRFQRWSSGRLHMVNADDSRTLDAFRGKVVLVEFWGTCCGPYLGRMPELRRLHEEYAERGLIIVGLHSTKGADAASALTPAGRSWRILTAALSSCWSTVR